MASASMDVELEGPPVPAEAETIERPSLPAIKEVLASAEESQRLPIVSAA